MGDDTTIRDATEQAIAAGRAQGLITGMDAGIVAAVLKLADEYDYLLAHDSLNRSGKFDNVTPSLYVRSMGQLGLTPAGRKQLQDGGGKAGSGGKLAQLRAVQAGSQTA